MRCLILFACLVSACAAKTEPACTPLSHAGNAYTVCKIDAAADIRLFLNRANGTPHFSFESVNAALEETGERLLFAMNAGMYHKDRTPVGLFIESGQTLAPLQIGESPGNFGLVPNGVFFIEADMVGVMETTAFAQSGRTPDFASQSGPMLVSDGALHPKFNADGPSKKIRNGVGVSENGEAVYFALSEEPVNFHSFASLFRDQLKTPNALFLDGTVSRLHDPAHERSDPGLAMGPIVGVVIARD